MPNSKQVSAEVLEFLRSTDTCTVSNAIESFEIRMRNEGFTHPGVRCRFPDLPPVVGYAVTGRIRTTAPPIAGLCYYQRVDWWEYCASLPGPKIMVMEDVDRVPGTGALFGEVHATIAGRLGFVAYVSNGTIRDEPALRDKRFQCFSHGLSVSHSYAHVVEFGDPVEVGGMKISTGDLLHGDEHGVQSIPLQIAAELPDRVAQILERESRLLEFCRSEDFRMEKLAAILQHEGVLCPSPNSRFS